MISVAQILSLDGADSRAPLLTDLPLKAGLVCIIRISLTGNGLTVVIT